jgi:hypothetical protein
MSQTTALFQTAMYLPDIKKFTYPLVYNLFNKKTDVYTTVVTYGCEFWILKKEDENILRRFERKIIRRIYGPVR